MTIELEPRQRLDIIREYVPEYRWQGHLGWLRIGIPYSGQDELPPDHRQYEERFTAPLGVVECYEDFDSISYYRQQLPYICSA